jgi:hypothetical protein
MNQLSFKTVKNVWAKSLSVLDNPYVNLTLVIVLILYSSKMFGNINEVINGLYQYTFIKLLVLLIIAYVAPKDTNIAILLAISYIMSLKNMNMENFIAKALTDITTTTTTQINTNNCESVKYLQKALYIYVTINSGLTDIIKSITDLKDPDLNNITTILTTLNSKFTEIIKSLKTTINTQLKGQNCIIYKPQVKITSLQDTLNTILTKATTKTTNGKISCTNNTATTTAYDNIFLSLASIADNIRVYYNSADKAQRLTVTCMTINNSITSIITNIETYLKGTSNSISDPNAVEIITALGTAKNGIDANIKYGTDLVEKYVSQILPTLCSIVNDKTYQNLIKNLPDNCKNNVASQLFILIQPKFDKYKTFFTQDLMQSLATSMKSTVLEKINAGNILNPNAVWLKSCPINESTTTTTTKSSSNNAPSLTKTMTINNNIYYKGVEEVANILNNKSTNKPSNDFGKGLLIAYKTMFKDDNTPRPKTVKNIDDEAKDIVENNKDVSDLAIGYAVAIVVVKIYYDRLSFNPVIKNKTDYFNNIKFIDTTTIDIIKIVSNALINKNKKVQAEAIGLATGMNATAYIYNQETNGFENFNDKDFEAIAINTKNVVSKNVKIKDAPELAKSYTNGSLIVRAIFSTYNFKNLKINYSVINNFTQKDKDKGIIYAQGIVNAIYLNDFDSFTSVDINLGNIFYSLVWPWH